MSSWSDSRAVVVVPDGTKIVQRLIWVSFCDDHMNTISKKDSTSSSAVDLLFFYRNILNILQYCDMT